MAVSAIRTKTVGAVFGTPPQVTYYHLDVLGSVRAVTGATAQDVIKRHDYLAFGEDPAPMTGDPRRFTGKELDAETALQYFGARYYRNTLGRFTTVDPHNILVEARSPAEFVGFLSNPQTWNRYSYVRNRPLTLTDPDGRCPHCPALAPVGAIPGGQVVVVGAIVVGASVVIYENREAIGRAIGDFFDDIGKALGLKASSPEGGDDTTWARAPDRPFPEKLDDIGKNPQDWVKTDEKTVESTRKGGRVSGTNTETEWTNTKTGEKIYQQTIKNDKGKIVGEPVIGMIPRSSRSDGRQDSRRNLAFGAHGLRAGCAAVWRAATAQCGGVSERDR